LEQQNGDLSASLVGADIAGGAWVAQGSAP
jgi:hypothetical protein